MATSSGGSQKRRTVAPAKSTRPRGASSTKSNSGAKSTGRSTTKAQRPTLAAPKVSTGRFSGEGKALALALVCLFVLASLESATFGPLGRAVSSLVRYLLGEVAPIVMIGAILFSGAHIAGARLVKSSRSWIALAGLSTGLVSFMAAVKFRGNLTFGASHLKDAGGLVGELVGGSLSVGTSRIGAIILTVFLMVLAILYVLGFSFDRVANSLASSVRSRRSSVSDGASQAKVAKFEAQAVSEPEPPGYSSQVEPDDDIEDLYFDLSDPIPPTEVEADGTDLDIAMSDQNSDEDSTAARVASKTKDRQWRLPSIGLLSKGGARKIDEVELAERGRALQAALLTHGVPTKLSGMTVGPTVTRYELELGEGIKVAKLLSLQRDIAYAMAATDIRILAPIPGRSAIGVEVPNKSRETVTLGDVLGSSEMKLAQHPLEVPLGRDIYGRTIVANLADMPHVLIAGATGSGKSSALNSIITAVLTKATPDQVRMILVDPKRVELGQYSRLPHLLSAVVVDPKKAAGVLSWATKEMDRRYDLLAEVGVRNITGYNELVDAAVGQDYLFDESESNSVEMEHLPYILVVVDELNDLMMVAPRDVEDSICRIAQKARAVGIHLLIATQRPSVDVITGVIKANVPSRMAFSVASQADSRVILDQPGAEKLIGKGDMLIVTADSSVPRRIQTPWVSESEVRSIVGHWLRIGGPAYLEELDEVAASDRAAPGDPSQQDDLYGQALSLVVSSQLGSTSMLQRKLRVGFARAGRLMDLLEQAGVVGPSEGSKPREVFMSKEELEELDVR